MTESGQWVCPGCNTTIATAYCPACGERQPQLHELTLRGLFDQAVEAFTSVDARLLRSIRSLLCHPGVLTDFYLQGSRKPYIGPFALFLLANVLFVAMEAVTGSNIFSTPLDMHLHNQPWSPYAQELVAQRLEAMQATLDTYAPVFNQAVAVHAKSLIILMVIPFALLPPIVFYKSRLPFAVHLAFSLHFHAFMLLFISIALVVPAVDELFGGAGLKSQYLDNAISIVLLVFCAAYLYLSARTVYGGTSAVIRTFKAVGLVVAAASIFLGYRFLLLLITLYST